jgi:hypothetical protein
VLKKFPSAFVNALARARDIDDTAIPVRKAMTICPHCRGSGFIVEIDPLAVVQAIAGRVGDRAFTVAELIALCVEDEALAEALGHLTARRLGKLLGKAVGVDHISDEGGSAVWQIRGLQ